MPPKVKSQNNSAKKKKKRKNISPLCENTSTQSTGEHEEKTSDAPVSPGQNKRHKQQTLHTDNQYFVYDSPTIQAMSNMNNMNNSDMFPQFQQGQVIQSPQGPYQPYMPHNMQNASISPPSQQHQQFHQPPPWAANMLKDIQGSIAKMETKIDTKMGNLEKMVSTVTLKLTTLEETVKGIDKRLQDVENNSTFLSEKYETQRKEISNARTNVDRIDQSCQQLNSVVTNLEQSCSSMNDKILDAEFRSMRDNLIFYGLSEDAPRTSGTNEEPRQPEANHSTPYDQETQQCTDIVKTFITNTLNINTNEMQFERAHRLGSNSAKKPRPVIVKFHCYQDRERVRRTALSKKDDLKKQNVGVGIQIPKEWREARQKLNHIYLTERQKGSKVKFIGDKLYVNDQLYKPAQLTH